MSARVRRYIKLFFNSDALWRDRLESLIRLLARQEAFRPDRWGPSEPVRRPFRLEALPEMEKVWSKTHSIMFKRAEKPKFWLDNRWFTHLPHAPSDKFFGGVEDKFFKSTENVRAFLDFTKELFAWGDMLHGYACHRMEYEAKNVRDEEVWLGTRRMVSKRALGINLYECLPGIYWANFFSKFYVDWFGEERIRSAPCYAQEELAGGGVLLLTAASPLDYEKPEVRELQQALIKHLGEDAFFSLAHPDRPCRTPFEYRKGAK